MADSRSARWMWVSEMTRQTVQHTDVRNSQLEMSLHLTSSSSSLSHTVCVCVCACVCVCVCVRVCVLPGTDKSCQ